MCCANILIGPHGEVVELVYGTSLENWRRLIAYRGFESHPLRQRENRKPDFILAFCFLIMKLKWRLTQVAEGDSLLNC